MLEIYDLHFNLLKKILGPEMSGTQKYQIEDDGEVVYVNTIPAAYSSFLGRKLYRLILY